jgi:hypothetical protein
MKDRNNSALLDSSMVRHLNVCLFGCMSCIWTINRRKRKASVFEKGVLQPSAWLAAKSTRQKKKLSRKMYPTAIQLEKIRYQMAAFDDNMADVP